MIENYAPQIIDGFKASVLKRVLVVDDAYDVPDLAEDSAGVLIDLLEGPALRDQLSEELLSEEDRIAAIESLTESNLDDAAVTKAMSSLYAAYVETRSPNVDPGGEFAALKGGALEALDPLTELLTRCTDAVDLRCVGRDDAVGAYRAMKPDLILMDFYLSPPERATRAATRGESDGDRERSIRVLMSMLRTAEEAIPSVVLMSSADAGGLARGYRQRLEGRVTSLRFGFLSKKWINGSGVGLRASGDAADVLIETSSSFEFGQALESALREWRTGATAGLEKLYKELSEFDTKDFAYLLRFRLYDARENFADYLEWFLGESLRAVVDDEVEWSARDFTRLNQPSLTSAIEGAHPLPSDRTAQFFHRMRFNSRQSRKRNRYGLGDVFVASNNRDVRMVITPECDLIPRENGPSASRLLTIGGVIRGLDWDHSNAGELIFRNSPKSIRWKYKDLATHKFDSLGILHVGETQYDYFGTLRPMPAQTIQKNALADLSRVGSAVTPLVDVGAPVRVFVKKDLCNQARMEEIEGLGESRVQVVMPRGGGDTRKRALFTERFVRDLVARVAGMNEDELLEDHRPHRGEWLGDLKRVRQEMLGKGLALPGESFCKVGVCVERHKGSRWLEIVVDVSDEALIRLSANDLVAY